MLPLFLNYWRSAPAPISILFLSVLWLFSHSVALESLAEKPNAELGKESRFGSEALVPGAEAGNLSSEVCRESFCFEGRWKLEGKELPLLGVTKFKYLLFSVYLMGLYADKEDIETKGLLGPVAKRLDIVYLRGIKKETLIKGATDYFDRHDPDFQKKYSVWLAELNSLYYGVKRGFSYSLQYTPGRGLRLYSKERLLGEIGDDDFANRYMAIWLSKNSKAASLLPELTGRK